MNKPHNEDRIKVLYGQIMMSAAPMFERLDDHDQAILFERVSHDIARKIQAAQACKRDYHITMIDEPDEVKTEPEAVKTSEESAPDAE